MSLKFNLPAQIYVPLLSTFSMSSSPLLDTSVWVRSVWLGLSGHITRGWSLVVLPVGPSDFPGRH